MLCVTSAAKAATLTSSPLKPTLTKVTAPPHSSAPRVPCPTSILTPFYLRCRRDRSAVTFCAFTAPRRRCCGCAQQPLVLQAGSPSLLTPLPWGPQLQGHTLSGPSKGEPSPRQSGIAEVPSALKPAQFPVEQIQSVHLLGKAWSCLSLLLHFPLCLFFLIL